MANFDALSTEIRLQIYGHVLTFDRPIKRARRSSCREENSIDTSMLSVSKQVRAEAMPVLYAQNTTIIRHIDVCSLRFGRVEPGAHAQDIRLVQSALLHDGCSDVDRKRGWPACNACGADMPALLERLRELMPKLESLAVDMTGCDASPSLVESQLLEGGFSTRCTEVGRYSVTSDRTDWAHGQLKRPEVTLDWCDISTAWLAALAHPGSGPYGDIHRTVDDIHALDSRLFTPMGAAKKCVSARRLGRSLCESNDISLLVHLTASSDEEWLCRIYHEEGPESWAHWSNLMHKYIYAPSD